MWKRFWAWLKGKWQKLKEVTKKFCHWVAEKAEVVVKKAVSLTFKYILPASIGAVVIWNFPVVGAIIASVPIARWVSRKLEATPVISAVVHTGLTVGAYALFAIFPWVGLTLAAYACIKEWKTLTTLFVTKFKEEMQKTQQRELASQAEVAA